MESLSQKLNLLSLKLIARVIRCQLFVYLIFLALLDYSSSMMLLMTFKMCKILLKSP